MPQNDLEIRVENLETTIAGLAGLPPQVRELSTQFLQLREDVRADISSVRVEVGELRDEMHGMRDELRGEMHGVRDELRGEMRGMRDELVGRIDGCRDELRGEMHGMHDELIGKIDSCRDELRTDMAAMHHDLAKAILDDRAQTLSLHEDLVERIKRLGEGLTSTAAAPPSDDAR